MTALKSIKIQAYQIVFWQLMIIMGLTIVIFLLRGLYHGVSTLIGGLAYWVPASIFTWRTFSRADIKAIKQFVIAFFAGEAAKLLLSAVLFLLAVKYMQINTLSALTGFISAIAAFWIASFILLSRHQGVRS